MDDFRLIDPVADMFGNRLMKNQRRLKRYLTTEGITCYRLYDKDIPEVPLAVDVYEGRLHISEYTRKRPFDESTLQSCLAAAADGLSISPKNIFVKRRERQRGLSQYETVSRDARTFTVHEAGLKFRVNLSDYLDTGLFLDHRPLRKRFGAEARGKDVLNLFCYTGAFTVHAVANRAKTTTSVDLSATYLKWTQENLIVNGLDTPSHHFVRDDLLHTARNAPEGPRSFDLAIVDPPTFSNSKKMHDTFDVQQDHVDLLRYTASKMRPGGVIYFSTNARRFQLAPDAVKGLDVTDITEETIPKDFRDQRIHRCFRLVMPG